MKLEIVVGDITKLEVDAIVNAANGTPWAAAAWTARSTARRAWGCWRNAGDPAAASSRRAAHGPGRLTSGHDLPAKHVIHTVGPVYDAVDDPAGLLGAAYRNSFALAEERGLCSIAFPAISTGVYGYPREEAARVVKDVLGSFPFRSVERVVLCYFSPDDKAVAERILG